MDRWKRFLALGSPDEKTFSLSKLKIFFLSLVFVACNAECFAQGGMWTWMNGDSTAFHNYSILGNPGQFDSTFHHIVPYEQCSWKDKQGMFWYMTNGDSL